MTGSGGGLDRLSAWTGVARTKFLPGTVDRKHPVDWAPSALRRRSHAATSATSVALSGIRRSRHWRTITPISISTMLSQLACLGVKWNSRRLEDPARFRRCKRLVQSGCGMRREVVEHHADPFGVGIVLVDEVAHALGEVEARSSVGHLGVSPGSVHVDEHEDVGGAVAHVFIIVAAPLAGFGTAPGLAPRRSAAAAFRRSRRRGVADLAGSA